MGRDSKLLRWILIIAWMTIGIVVAVDHGYITSGITNFTSVGRLVQVPISVIFWPLTAIGADWTHIGQ
jgi:hypothetical protein